MESLTTSTKSQTTKDESNTISPHGNQSETTQYSEDPAQVEAILIPHLEKMFEIENVKATYYLVSRLNSNMEIRVSSIYRERSVNEITQDIRIIDSALQKCKNVEYLPDIKSIRLKAASERNTILVKGIPAAKETDFHKFIEGVCGKDEKAKQFEISYDRKNECASIHFPDESTTLKIFSELMNSKFQENQVDCMIKDTNPYIELWEVVKNGRGGMGGTGGGPGTGYRPYQSNYYPKPMFNPYQQYQPMYMMMPPPNYQTNYYQPYNKGSWGAGYRGGNPNYYNKGGRPQQYNRKYNKYEENKADEVNQEEEEGVEKQERKEYRSGYKGGYKGESRGEYRGGERGEYRGDRRGRGGYSRRGNNQDRKFRSKEEIEKLTAEDPDNYPPLN